jgi:redox-sensitive bicupin YhaK (pirin superfamily)
MWCEGQRQTMSNAIITTIALDFQWPTLEPFLFCVHHDDAYPKGNAQLGPAASLEGRQLGHDFDLKNSWKMYHGRVVPGFPQHPHRGFETVTIARRGFIDHSDSLGAAARFGQGDVQWMTAGKGIVHSEMFPLLQTEQDNPVELFQIWLNLPRKHKMVEPHFSMLWHEKTPKVLLTDEHGRQTTVTVIAGEFAKQPASPPPPNSWAADPDSQVAIYTIVMQPNARWTLPAAPAEAHRTLYFFAGNSLTINGQRVGSKHAIQVVADQELVIENGDSLGELLLLQARPINEPVAQHGPFVMNTRDELMQAFRDYQRTQFGGWPWPSDDPAHPRDEGRFARRADGTIERP